MTGLLISVTNLKEAEIALNAGVDILDMKNPAEGALGRLPLETIAEIVSITRKRCITSATVGDLPMEPKVLANAVEQVIGTGVDIVKIGFFGQDHHVACANAIGISAKKRARLIAVMMADELPGFTLIPALKAAGFYGVMIDTASKRNRHLLDYLDIEELRQFCTLAKAHDMTSGLAGSLKESHIPILGNLGADYLGFRGAACIGNNRIASLDEYRLLAIKHLLHKSNSTLSEGQLRLIA